MPPRSITVLCLIQICCLVLTWVLVGRFLRSMESLTAAGDEFEYWKLKSAFAIFADHFRTWGLLLLFVPIAVAAAGTRWSYAEGRHAVAEPRAFWLALGVTAALFIFLVVMAGNGAFMAAGKGTVLIRLSD